MRCVWGELCGPGNRIKRGVRIHEGLQDRSVRSSRVLNTAHPRPLLSRRNTLSNSPRKVIRPEKAQLFRKSLKEEREQRNGRREDARAPLITLELSSLC